MEWLNYHHLLYFWTVAREGSITKACETLNLAPSTVSGQISQLEASFGNKLFKRTGRNLVLTDFGQQTFRYADEIFNTGRELMDFVHGRPVTGPVRFDVGVTEVVPKLIVRRIVEAAVGPDSGVHLTLREGHADELLADLALHHLDLVLADAPVSPETRIRAFTRVLADCDATLFAVEELAAELAPDFPHSLTGEPMLLPTSDAVLRRQIDHWLDHHDIHPRIVAEFQDAAQLHAFAEHGYGAFVAPDIIADEIEAQYGVRRVGTLEGIREKFYAISVERTVKHPCVMALYQAADDQNLLE